MTGHGDPQVQALLPANVAAIDAVADVVGITVAEFIPRHVIHLQQLLISFSLLRASNSTP